MAWIDQFNGVTSLEEFRRLLPDEETARRLLEALVWPTGRFCPNCGDTSSTRSKTRRNRELASTDAPIVAVNSPPRRGPHFTPRNCRSRSGLLAIYQTLMSSKGISSVILGRQLGIKQGSAWKVAQAIRLMMRPPAEVQLIGTVEVDTGCHRWRSKETQHSTLRQRRQVHPQSARQRQFFAIDDGHD